MEQRVTTDHERLCLGAVWADEAHRRLGDELNRACAGRTPATVRLDLDMLETLHDGLQVLADVLNAMTLPFPPPAVPPARHLRLVK